MHSVPGMLRKMSAWKDYCDSERSIIDAMVRMQSLALEGAGGLIFR
jgi:hypothetical protein